MKDIEIAPSILAADFGYLMRDIKAVEKNAEYLHIDVMDGHYVNNISFGIPVIQSIRKYTDMKFYTHLMITNPEKYIKAFADAGSDNITFHLECSDDPLAIFTVSCTALQERFCRDCVCCQIHEGRSAIVHSVYCHSRLLIQSSR